VGGEMKMPIGMKVMVGIFCLVMYVWTWGALMADLQGSWPSLADEDYRDDLATSAGFSLIPVIWFLSPFLTGFYEHGWTLSRRAKRR
jgi:hypothetical protein